MTWLIIFTVVALAMFALLRAASAASRLDELLRSGAMPLPTARQRRQWKRERLKLNPALRRKA